MDRVLAHLGTGSKSTIAPLLKQWKGKNGQGPTSTTGLPDDLVDAMKNLYAHVNQKAAQKISQVEEASQKVAEHLQQKLTQTEDIASTLSKTNTALEQQRDDLTHRNEKLTKDLDESIKKLVQKEIELNSDKQQLIDRKETIGEQRAEVHRIRDHLEHYQTEMAEERQRERQQLHAQITQLETNLAHTLQEKENALNKIDLLEKSVHQSQEQLQTCETRHQAITLTLKTLENDHQHLNNELCEANTHLKTARQQCMDVSDRLKNTAMQKAIVKIERDNVQTDADKLEAKMINLTDQCAVLQQEKAILQGQLKQIQSTL